MATPMDERAANVCDTPPADDRDASPGGTSYRWGRVGNSTWVTSIGSLGMMLLCPMVAWLFLWTCAEHDCSLQRSGQVLWRDVTTKPFWMYARRWDVSRIVTAEAAAVWTVWLLVQVLLYQLMPGPKDRGQPTPAGYTLKYVVNGWNCWWATHIAVLALLYFVTGFRAATIVTRNWMGIFWIANIAGFALALLVYLKALLAPTHARDNKWSGSVFYDIFMGCEHNPRLTSHPYSFDFKLFFNGRPGILAWTLINICFAAAQYERFGFVTNSMIILNFLQGIYVLDFFWNEGWYLRTIDICHEHFGFYLSWGDLVWLPFVYTLQGLYLSTHAVQLSDAGAAAVLALGVGGYALFRAVNAQKDRFRKEMKRLDAIAEAEADGAAASSEAAPCDAVSASISASSDGQQLRARGKGAAAKTDGAGASHVHGSRTVSYRGHSGVHEMAYRTWGEATRYLAARYHVRSNGGSELRHSYLLLSGFWGLSRHFNYLGDLMLSLSWCLCCGFGHLLPFFYIAFMTALLVHRVARDDLRCRQKYGKVWDKYCSIVRWKICPGIY